jgi:hypothetical protein
VELVEPESAVVDEGSLKFKRADLNCVFHVHQSQPDLYEAILNITDYCQATSSAEIQNLLNTILELKIILFVPCGSECYDSNFSALLK